MIRYVRPGSGSRLFTHPGSGSATLQMPSMWLGRIHIMKKFAKQSRFHSLFLQCCQVLANLYGQSDAKIRPHTKFEILKAFGLMKFCYLCRPGKV
jgi:hypothetical protein